MARTPRTIQWCRVHQANGRRFDSEGTERCYHAATELLIDKDAQPERCDWVICNVMVITPKPELETTPKVAEHLGDRE